jgi:hypothetical protein
LWTKGRCPFGIPGPVWGWAGLSARRLAKFVDAVGNRTHQNVEVYGRSEDETPRKCILQAEKHYAWRKKTLRRTFVSLSLSSGNKSSPQNFSAPGIMFPARRNIYFFGLHPLPKAPIAVQFLSQKRFFKLKLYFYMGQN